jgi:hypothetical protein
MNDDSDPLLILATTKDPQVAGWAASQLEAAGFTNVEQIARDFGWEIRKTA